MSSCLLFILAIAPLIVAGAITFSNSLSLVSVLMVLLGAIAGAILISLSGIHWLYVFHRSWMESQAAGFIFLPVVLPFCAYTGSVAGSCLVAILSGYKGIDLPSPVFQLVAIGFTVVLNGLIPSAIAAIPYFSISSAINKFAIVPIFAIGSAAASSWLASKSAYFLVDSIF